jgi:hypothetical protein
VPAAILFDNRHRVISRPTGRRWICSVELQVLEIEFVHERIDQPNGVVLSNPVIQTIREQNGLRSAHTFDKSLHRILPASRDDHCTPILRDVFTQPQSSADANLSPLIVEAHYVVLEEIPAEYSLEVPGELER